MMSDVVFGCALCGNRTIVAQVVVSLEARSDAGRWKAAGDPETWALCPRHWAWWEERMRAALNGHSAGQWQLGVPGRPESTRLHPNLCDTCVSRHGSAAWSIEVLPGIEQLRKLNMRPLGPARKVRLCRHCAMWWRLHIRDGQPPESRNVRAVEGESGSWLQQANADAVAFGLHERDMEVLAKTVETTGKTWHETMTPFEALQQQPGAVLFVGASGWMGQSFHQLQPADRRRVVLVTGPDGSDEAQKALLRGAGDFLVRPISPQQIAGAFQRVLARPQAARHHSHGLPVLPPNPRSDWGQPAQVFDVYVPPGIDVMSTALLLRRFLRGYDDIGCDGGDSLRLYVYCPGAAVERVLTRLRGLVESPALVTYRGASAHQGPANRRIA